MSRFDPNATVSSAPDAFASDEAPFGPTVELVRGMASRARSASLPRGPRSARSGTLLTLVLTGSLLSGTALGQASARKPWEFADPAEKSQAQRSYPGTRWNDHYQAAEEILKGSSPDLDKAIARLRLAVSFKPASKHDEDHPSEEGRIMQYLPYYQLAIALSRKGLDEDAWICAQKEQQLGEIQKSNLKKPFESLLASLGAARGRGRLLELARRAQAWEGGQGEVLLSAEGRKTVADLNGSAQALRSAAPGAVMDLSAKLIEALAKFSRDEVRARGELLRTFGSDPWRAAFGNEAALVDPGVCQPADVEKSAEGAAAALDAVERCSKGVTKATQRAGKWACDDLEAMRRTATGLAADLRAWDSGQGAKPSPDVALPEPLKSCIEWPSSAPADVASAFETLVREREAVRRTLQDRKQDLTARLGAAREALRAELRAVRERIPEVAPSCVVSLQLGKTADQLRTLRDQLDPAGVTDSGLPRAEVRTARASVDRQLQEFVVRLEQGVGQLANQKAECEGVPATNLDALAGKLAAYKNVLKSADLGALCATALGADRDVTGCLERNTASLREDVRNYTWLVDLAARGRQQALRSAPAGEDPAGCLAKSASSLRPGASPASPAAWVRQVRPALTEAQACLKDVTAFAETSLASVAEGIDQHRKLVDGLAGNTLAAAGGEIGARITSKLNGMKADLAILDTTFKKVSPLYAAGDRVNQGAALRNVLTDAGLGRFISADDWRSFETVSSRPQLQAQAWSVIRDAAVAPELSRAAGKLDEWRSAVNLAPLLALNTAFLAYATGDLDAAILALRRARGRKDIPSDAGRAAAVAHAAMSLFLYTKRTGVAAAGAAELARRLETDAAQEAQRALRADATFRLPAFLARNRSFESFFGSRAGTPD